MASYAIPPEIYAHLARIDNNTAKFSPALPVRTDVPALEPHGARKIAVTPRTEPQATVVDICVTQDGKILIVNLGSHWHNKWWMPRTINA